MKNFEQITFDPKEAKIELEKFSQLLSKDELKERDDIQELLYNSTNLLYWIGSINTNIINTCYATEYPIEGDFKTDLVLQDSYKDTTYTLFIELENAAEDSIFKKQDKKCIKDWGSRFEHGFSQIIDWFNKLDDIEKTDSFREKFGNKSKYNALLIIGRDKFLTETDKRRLQWRIDKTSINTRFISCMTYDELYEMLERKINTYYPN